MIRIVQENIYKVLSFSQDAHLRSTAMLSFLVILFFLHLAAASVILDCTYSVKSWFPIGNVYTCDAGVVNNSGTRNVAEVSQNHDKEMTEWDVKALRVVNQRIDFFPENIDLFFLNLEAIYFAYVPIISISEEDLKPFPLLRYFGIEFSLIATIKGDIFMHSPELQLVSFFGNKITNVGPGIFDHCPKLAFAYFQNNLCIDEYNENDATAIENIVEELAFRCPPTAKIDETAAGIQK